MRTSITLSRLGLLILVRCILALVQPVGLAWADPPVFVTKWGSYGGDNGQFIDLRDIAVDSTGHVYVADHGNSRIQKFDGSGAFLITWSWDGVDNIHPLFPAGVAVDSLDNVYVSDTVNDRIDKFDNRAIF